MADLAIREHQDFFLASRHSPIFQPFSPMPGQELSDSSHDVAAWKLIVPRVVAAQISVIFRAYTSIFEPRLPDDGFAVRNSTRTPVYLDKISKRSRKVLYSHQGRQHPYPCTRCSILPRFGTPDIPTDTFLNSVACITNLPSFLRPSEAHELVFMLRSIRDADFFQSGPASGILGVFRPPGHSC